MGLELAAAALAVAFWAALPCTVLTGLWAVPRWMRHVRTNHHDEYRAAGSPPTHVLFSWQVRERRLAVARQMGASRSSTSWVFSPCAEMRACRTCRRVRIVGFAVLAGFVLLVVAAMIGQPASYP